MCVYVCNKGLFYRTCRLNENKIESVLEPAMQMVESRPLRMRYIIPRFLECERPQRGFEAAELANQTAACVTDIEEKEASQCMQLRSDARGEERAVIQ